MYEIARVTLENEMDLILAHKRSMKLAELAGLSLAAQTTFATAVSEVSRSTIDTGKSGCLILNFHFEQKKRYIVACLKNEETDASNFNKGLEYAKRLVEKYNVSTRDAQTLVELYYVVHASTKINTDILEEWKTIFRIEQPISAYDELKKKNEQLHELSERLKKSESQYKTLTNTLPMIIFSLDMDGQILYANEWLSTYTGSSVDDLNKTKWKEVIHEQDYDSFSLLLNTGIVKGTTTIKTQSRLKNKFENSYLWHQISLSPFRNENEEIHYWIGYIVDIHAQKVFEETLKDNIELKETQEQLRHNQLTLETYISELNRSNLELQQFAFIASHDLQEPVRKILFYSDYLLNRYTESIDQKGVDFIKNMQASSYRMRALIQDLLVFSRINKEQLKFASVDLNNVVEDSIQDLEMAINEKQAILNISVLPVINGDEGMMRQVFENIISNALKYSRPEQVPVIDISYIEEAGNFQIRFKDNGIGFDEKYLPQMFTLFQRLHARESYEGNGLGLAICRKIVDLHHGSMWAESREGGGATFFVSVPVNQPTY